MQIKIVRLLGALLLLGYGVSGLAHDEPDEEETKSNWSHTFGYASNFMYRGISFSNDKSTTFGSFDWSYGNWFAGAYGIALVDQDGSGYDTEIDYYFGYSNSIGKLEWFVQPIYYDYINCDGDRAGNFFGADRPLRCEFFEVWLDGTYPITEQLSVHAWYAYTPDFEFESGTGHYLWTDITYDLGYFSLHAGAGHQDVEGGNYSKSFGGDDETFGWHYWNYEIGISASLQGFDLDLTYHTTDADTRGFEDNLSNYIPDQEFRDNTTVFTISRTF